MDGEKSENHQSRISVGTVAIERDPETPLDRLFRIQGEQVGLPTSTNPALGFSYSSREESIG